MRETPGHQSSSPRLDTTGNGKPSPSLCINRWAQLIYASWLSLVVSPGWHREPERSEESGASEFPPANEDRSNSCIINYIRPFFYKLGHSPPATLDVSVPLPCSVTAMSWCRTYSYVIDTDIDLLLVNKYKWAKVKKWFDLIRLRECGWRHGEFLHWVSWHSSKLLAQSSINVSAHYNSITEISHSYSINILTKC